MAPFSQAVSPRRTAEAITRSGNYRFDRRHTQRHPAAGLVTLHRCDHHTTAYQHPICSLNLQDLSDGGLSAVSDVPLAPHESVAVFFPSHGVDGGFDLHGHIVRCTPTKRGYRVAIQYDLHRAA